MASEMPVGRILPRTIFMPIRRHAYMPESPGELAGDMKSGKAVGLAERKKRVAGGEEWPLAEQSAGGAYLPGKRSRSAPQVDDLERPKIITH